MSTLKTNRNIKEIERLPTVAPNINIQQSIDKLMVLVADKSDFVIPIVVIGSLVTFVIYQIYSAINDKESLNNLTTHVYFIAIPIIILFSYTLYIIFDNKTKYMFFLLVIFLLVVFFVVYGLVQVSNVKLNLTIGNLLYYGLIGSIILFGLTIFYNVFQNQLRTTDTWSSFFLDLIFYIPCMIDMFIKYITKDYANTSSITLIIFVIEILLIIFYFLLYPMYTNSIYDNGTIVLKNPVFLKKVTSNLIQPIVAVDANKIPPIQTSANPLQYFLKEDPSTFAYRTNYSISMWVYVNPMPMSRLGYAQETNLFLYGRGWNSSLIPKSQNSWEIMHKYATLPTTPSISQSEKVEYHPRLTMTEVDDNTVFNFYYSGDKATHQLEMPMQKWNNIVFNYIENGVDVFINGELTLSYNFSNDMPEYDEDDDIIVGDENGIINIDANAIYGSICNIVYYNIPLTKRDIVLNYNMLMLKNPPIISDF